MRPANHYQINICWIFVYLLILVLLTGCWGFSIPASAPERFHDTQKQQSFIGSSINDVIDTLGYPESVLASDTAKYYLYKQHGGGLMVGFLFYVPYVVGPTGPKEGSIHCLQIEVGRDNIIKSIQVRNKRRLSCPHVE